MTTQGESTRLQQAASAGLALGLVLLGLFTLWRFLSTLAWAGILAIALWPLFRRTRQRLGLGAHNVLLPALFSLAVGLVFIVPLAFAGTHIAREMPSVSQWAEQVRLNGLPEPDVLHRLPVGGAQVDEWWQKNFTEPGGMQEFLGHLESGRIISDSRLVGALVARRLTLFVFTLLVLFFLFRKGDDLILQLRRASIRAFGPSGERIGRQMIASVHGTVNGLVLVGLGEGFLLGIAYAVAGVPHAAILGALTAVAAMVPFMAPVVFTVCALLLLAKGMLGWGITLFCLGMVITFTADHFIRPVLIGGATKLPFIWVLLGILGGLEAWGLIGLFLGPAIMAALILLWREWAGDVV